MAMARGSTQPGFSAAHIWMIVFAVLWLVSTGLLVWVYTDQEAVKKENQNFREANERLILPGEQSLPYIAQARQGGPTVVGLVEQARAETAKLATGSADDNAETVKNRFAEVNRRIIDEGLVPDPRAFEIASLTESLTTLYAAYTSLHQKWQEVSNRADDQTQQIKVLSDAADKQRSDFETRAADIAKQFVDITSQWEEYRAQREEQITGFKKDYEDFQQKSSRGNEELKYAKDRLDKDLTELKQRFAELQQKLGELQISPVPLQTLREADGVILAAKAGEDVVYINLGQDAHLTLGLQFAVYTSDTGIPADGKGKARVEVVSIYDRSAACRIVEVYGRERILEGDLVANPIYDRSRALTFLVLGDFDLDHDGRPDPNGVEQVSALIEKWGGQTVQDVSARIDFVVTGAPPQEPRTAGEATAEVVERTREVTEKFRRFTQQLQTAHSLSIPVLTQEVFLRFLGYRATDTLPTA